MRRIALALGSLLILTAVPAAAAPASAGGLWPRLERYRRSHLREWWSTADPSDRSAEAALDAFRELVYRFTGPGGLWREEAPHVWFGCRSFPESPACEALTSAVPELTRWDALVEHTLRLDERGAERFVRRHRARLLLFLDRYVPGGTSADAACETPFYRERLAAVADHHPLDDVPLD